MGLYKSDRNALNMKMMEMHHIKRYENRVDGDERKRKGRGTKRKGNEKEGERKEIEWKIKFEIFNILIG